MIKRFCLVAALGLIGVARTATDALSAKPAPITKPVTVEFWDRAGDNIKSDGQGVYMGKVFYGSSASGDMQVELERTPRRFNFLFYPIATACDPESEPSPSGMLSDGEGMSIRGMHHVPVGETRANTASFGTSVGFFRFLGQDTPNPPHCSIRVMVYRESETKWVVSTDPGMFPEVENTSVMLNTGSIAELLRWGKGWNLEFLGNYPMPFKITVTCPTCN